MVIRLRVVVAFVMCIALAPTAAWAQRFAFTRTFPAAEVSTLDVSTERGRIIVVASDIDRIVVEGTATVRAGWNVPADAVDIARRVAAAPPVEQHGRALELGAGDAAVRQAVTVSYEIRVPRATEVHTSTDSGATSVRGLSSALTIRTHSAAIDVDSVSGAVSITTGSGAVTASQVSAPLSVTTSSSAVRVRDLGASLRVRTQSGEVNATLTGTGDVDVETGSSAILLRGVRGGLRVSTQSGRIEVGGAPGSAWRTTTGSSSVSLVLDERIPFSVDAASGSGSVDVAGTLVEGSVTKRAVRGAVDGGGPLVSANSRSGSIRVAVPGR